ncbi:MAG: phosphatase PAP2 family protein [Phocaeicola sp.]|uniref:phosphatase PAP2 family protein n=1 Tax=Phocaeicola sp. TaxID=2773926 RepID=UPI003F9F714F
MDIQQLIAFDKNLLLQLNGSDSLFVDGFMWAATSTIVWIPAGLALLFIFIKNNTREKALFTLFMLVACVLVANIISGGICKPYFARLRPVNDPDIMYLVNTVNDFRPNSFSFLSSHSANSFALAVFASLLIKKCWFVFSTIAWAILHAFTRIYLGVHFPGDIIFGIIDGVVVAFIFYFLHNFLRKRIFPETHFSPDQYKGQGYVVSDLKVFYFVLLLTLILLIFLGIRFSYSLSL